MIQRSTPRLRNGLTFPEVIIATIVVGLSMVPILDLVRNSTISLEVSELDTVMRTFAGDVLERFAGPPPTGNAPLISPQTKQQLSAPYPADLLLASDPYLGKAYPTTELVATLKRAQATVALTIENPPTHPTLSGAKQLDCFRVTMRWVDANGTAKEMKLARFVAR